MKIITNIENPLFNRKEIQASVEAQVTPSREDIIKLVSEEFSAPIENIKIRTIQGRFGSKIFIIVANIYNSKEDKDNIERKSKRDFEENKSESQDSAKEEAVKEEPKQEKPVEIQEEKSKEDN